MIEFDIDINQKTPYLLLLESLVNQSKAFKTIHNPKTWCLSALTYALHLNDCLVLFEDLKTRWSLELPFEEAWDVDFHQWSMTIWSAVIDIKYEEDTQWKSLCDGDYKKFIELSKQVADGEITITPLVEFVAGKESSFQKIIKDAGEALCKMFSDIERTLNKSDDSQYLSFHNRCIESYKEKNKGNLYTVRGQSYDAWEASKTKNKRFTAIQKLMDDTVKSIGSHKSMSEVWNDCFDADKKEINGEAIGRYICINRNEIISNRAVGYKDALNKLFFTVTMVEFLKERLYEMKLELSPDKELLKQRRQKNNKVFRTEKDGRTINLDKLYKYLKEKVVDSISYKYEWMALYLFAKNHNLLCDETLLAFAEQMNQPEWFGNTDCRLKCAYDAMSDYNFLSTNNKNRWNDNTIIPGGGKASRSGIDRITRKYDELDLDFKIDDIC